MYAAEYKHARQYNETTAVLSDGREFTVTPQYDSVLAKCKHADDCDQVCKMGGRCTCGGLDGVDVAALLADAKEFGKFGPEPQADAALDESHPAWRSERGLTLDEEMSREDSDY